MATYKSKKSIGTLNASVNLSYGGKSIVKALTREYDEVYDIRKTLGTNVTQLVAFNTSQTFLAGTLKDSKCLLICNEGDASALLQLKMAQWNTTAGSHAGASAARIIQVMLHAGDYIVLPNLYMVFSDNSVATAINGDNDGCSNAVPDANLYVDSNVNTDEALAETDDHIHVADIAPFEVGDLIQVGINATTATRIEVMEVTSITDDSGTDQDSTGILNVRRGLFGTSKADASGGNQTDVTNGAVSGANVHFPIFNEYYDHDRALSGSKQLIQTDAKGRWKSRNFFGKGRSAEGNDAEQGLVAGSIALKFYKSAYQEVSFGSTTSNILINANTDSKLTPSTSFSFNLTIDDSSATTISFTTDSTNTNFGGTNGVITKIQDAINTATQTTGNGLYGYSCTVSIVNGRLRFTSNSHLAPHPTAYSATPADASEENGSKILLADAGSANLFSGSAGIFPDDAVINAPVEAVLPDDTIIDTRSGTSYANIDDFMYDDGYGKLIYQGNVVGSIVYLTGAIEWEIPSLPNAQFVISAHYSAAFSGGHQSNGNLATDNALNDIFGCSVNPKLNAVIGIYTFN